VIAGVDTHRFDPAFLYPDAGGFSLADERVGVQ
jgi:hypothetical protein